jgi:hypothetical protein
MTIYYEVDFALPNEMTAHARCWCLLSKPHNIEQQVEFVGQSACCAYPHLSNFTNNRLRIERTLSAL